LVHGRRRMALVQLWLVTISIKLYSFELGSFKIKSMAIVEKGCAKGAG